MRVLQQILISGRALFAAHALGNVWAGGHRGLGRRGAAIGAHRMHQQRLAVGHPLHRAAAAAAAPPRAARPPPNTSFTCTFGTRCVRPVAASPIHTSMPAAVELVKTKRLPSGLHGPISSFGFGGSAILISVPSGILRSSRFDWKVVLCSPLVFGLMRIPASRNMGSDSSAMGG